MKLLLDRDQKDAALFSLVPLRIGSGVPFFCDDIFETIDEDRTQSACRVMERIGRTGQSPVLKQGHKRHDDRRPSYLCRRTKRQPCCDLSRPHLAETQTLPSIWDQKCRRSCHCAACSRAGAWLSGKNAQHRHPIGGSQMMIGGSTQSWIIFWEGSQDEGLG